MTAPPACLLIPTWDKGVEHDEAWQTQLLASDDGTEQRVQIREAAAESIRFTTLVGSIPAVGALELLLAQAPDVRVNLPRWFDATALTSALAPGATSVPCDTTDRGFVSGGQLVILDLSTGINEVRTIAGVSGGALDVTGDAVILSWAGGAGVIVLPIAPARIKLPVERTYVGGVVAELALTADWEVEAPPSAASTAAVPVAMNLVADGYGWSSSLTIIEIGGDEYAVVHVEVFDADGLIITDPATLGDIAWLSSDVTRATVQPIGPPRSATDATPTGEIALIHGLSGSGLVTVTVTATLGSVVGTMLVDVYS